MQKAQTPRAHGTKVLSGNAVAASLFCLVLPGPPVHSVPGSALRGVTGEGIAGETRLPDIE
jgi:hypothetical protein